MIVRTYGRRSSRSSFSDSLDSDGDGDNSFLGGGGGGGGRDSFSLSQETPSKSFYDFPFSSQESSSFWPNSSQDDLPPRPRKSKKTRNGKLEEEGRRAWVPLTSTTLMEAQEYGEMMEHVDEVNFAIDGLRKGQPVRIRRASLLSLLTICGTAQKRRLLRAQGNVAIFEFCV